MTFEPPEASSEHVNVPEHLEGEREQSNIQYYNNSSIIRKELYHGKSWIQNMVSSVAQQFPGQPENRLRCSYTCHVHAGMGWNT